MGQRRSPLDVVELELLAARGWRGTEAERLGDWVLRAGGGGYSSRAHSALAVGDPGVPLPAAVRAVEEWYRARGLRPCVQLPGRQARGADAVLAAAGWDRDEDTLVLTVELDDRTPEPPAPVHLAPQPDEAWLRACRQHGDGPLPAGATTVLTGADRVVFASVRAEDGAVLAVARGVRTDDWLGVSAVTVAEGARRRGLATSVTRGLQGWAVREGAGYCYLQVVASNAPARELYRRLGFIEHHRYHYRRAAG
ncbi:GNAT family N-acetyltransferase [Klenkia sp. LSe6-5]|uniref:GNAT family N-acetyltransferase n=1 Tax=Klenkia sesuvii TaxID=3103137 RepID=A0ABU8DPL3_9ACTN